MTDTNIVLTGVSGVLGQPLARRLARDDRVGSLVGVSRGPLPATLAGEPKVSHVAADIRDVALRETLAGADILVHGAFLPYGRDLRHLESVNVHGSAALHRLAVESGVRYIAFVSSAAAYGSHADNPVPLSEEDPLRANPESFYSSHKAAVELDLDRLEKLHDDLRVLRLRPSIMLGRVPDAGTEAIRRFYHLFVPRFRLERSEWQFMDLDEAVEAMAQAVLAQIVGPLNISSGDSISTTEMAHITGGRPVVLPQSFARAVPLLHRLGISPVGRDRLALSRHGIVLSPTRMTDLTGVEPMSSAGALERFMRPLDD